MIEVGDLVRIRLAAATMRGVWLVLKISGSNVFVKDRALCAKGSRRLWVYYNEVEKL